MVAVTPGLAPSVAAPLALDSFDLLPEQVHARFRWASLQGEPRWLWPDVAIADWRRALACIETITREVLFAGRSEREIDGHAAAIGIAGYTSGMAPLLGLWLERGQVRAAPEVAALLELHLRHNRLRMHRMADRARMVGEALSRHGIAAVLLKGMHTAFDYFPEAGARPLSDIDLLIAPANNESARDVLLAFGFQPGLEQKWPFEQTWRHADAPTVPRTLSLVHAEDPWTLDLHTSLNRRYAVGAPLLDLDAAFGDTAPSPLPLASGLCTLGQPALLLQLAVHASCGLINLTLVRLVELALVIRRAAADSSLLWPVFVDAAAQSKALGSVYPALKLCDDLLPGTVPPDVLSAAMRKVPQGVLRLVDPLVPATAHQVVRCSMAERFMWAPSRWAVLRQVLSEVFPPGSSSLPALAAIYRTRIMRLGRGTVTR